MPPFDHLVRGLTTRVSTAEKGADHGQGGREKRETFVYYCTGKCEKMCCRRENTPS